MSRKIENKVWKVKVKFIKTIKAFYKNIRVLIFHDFLSILFVKYFIKSKLVK